MCPTDFSHTGRFLTMSNWLVSTAPPLPLIKYATEWRPSSTDEKGLMPRIVLAGEASFVNIAITASSTKSKARTFPRGRRATFGKGVRGGCAEDYPRISSPLIR